MYSGAECETSSPQLVAIKRATAVTSTIAIICLVGFYSLALASDLFDLLVLNKRPKPNAAASTIRPIEKKKRTSESVRFAYVSAENHFERRIVREERNFSHK
jgi:hypothetical protein